MPHMDRRLWQSVSPLLDQALDLDPDARTILVRSVRSSDPALAATLEELLAHHFSVLTSDFLETPTVTARELAPSLAALTIGAYTLERPLGVGGMGTVWLARRSDGRFEGKVALKLVNFAVFDPLAQQRFAREGTVLARLAHPHIGRLFDAGITAAGQPYLVLEYVNGTRIDEFADTHRLTVRRRLELFTQVADAVAHAHANLIVHRDLKPSNILVDHEGRVKLLDFGIAKLIEEETAIGGDARTLLTAPALTPRYAAPEQVSGRAVTTATDVYALGVLLYELLAGSHPTIQDEDTPGAQVHAVLTREPIRLSDAVRRLAGDRALAEHMAGARATSVDRVRRACRGDLTIILAKALKQSPLERYATAAAFADDVRRHLHGEPVIARRDSLLYRANKFLARHRLGLAAAASVVIALVAGSAIALVQARESAYQRDQALIQLRRAEATNELSTFLLEAKPSGKPFSTAEMLARGETMIARRFAKDASLRVFMQLTLADRYFDNQQYEARNRILKQAYGDSQTIADVGLRSYATCHWASNLAEHGQFQQAFALFDDVMPLLSRSPEYVEFEANCRLFESIAANHGNDGARAIRAGERGLLLEEQRAIPGSEFEALSALATAYRSGLRYDDSIKTFRRAYALAESQDFQANSIVTLLGNWSGTLQDVGQMIDAAAVSERAVRRARAEDPEKGPGYGLLSTYGNALIALGHYAEATRIIDESLEKARRAGSPRRHIQTLAFAFVLAAESGDVARGSRLIREANAVLAADTSATPYSKALVDVGTARVALASGELARAVTLAEHGATTLETATPTQSGLVLARLLLARCLNAAGRFSEALIAAEKSVQLVDSRLPGVRHSYQMGQALLELAHAKAGLGDTPAARATIARALEHLHATVGAKSRATERAETLRREIEAH